MNEQIANADYWNNNPYWRKHVIAQQAQQATRNNLRIYRFIERNDVYAYRGMKHKKFIALMQRLNYESHQAKYAMTFPQFA